MKLFSFFPCLLSGPSSFVINRSTSTTVFALLSTLAIAVSATFPDAPQLDTNAKRFAV